MSCDVVNMSCVQAIRNIINKLQVEVLETRREQVSQLKQIVEQINQQMRSIQEELTTGQSPDQTDKVCYINYTSTLYMYTTLRKRLMLQTFL